MSRHRGVLVIELAVPEDQLVVDVAQEAIDGIRAKVAGDDRFVAMHLGIEEVADAVLEVFG